MRWIQGSRVGFPKPKIGDTRFITRFLIVPRCIQGEWRWLETVYIEQKLMQIKQSIYELRPVIGWVDKRWAYESEVKVIDMEF